MSEVKTGGPAFPGVDEHGEPYTGMTLRDYFAAKVMAALVHNRTPGSAAKEAYQYADAMLKAREA